MGITEELDSAPPSWAGLALFALTSRVVVLAAGLVVAHGGTPIPRIAGPANAPHHDRHERHLERIRADPVTRGIDPWYRWDAIWYAEIVEVGYVYQPGAQTTTGFLPLLPVVMDVGRSVGLNPYLVGLVVPNLAFVVGLPFFGRLSWRATGSARTAWVACLILVSYPGSLFFSAPYQESLGFALVSVALWAWMENRAELGACALAVAGLARLTTVVVSAAVVVGWGWDRVRGVVPRRGTWWMAAAGCFGVVAMMEIMGREVGEPMAHFRTHREWGRGSPGLGPVLKTFFDGVNEVVREPKLLWVLGPMLVWAGREALVDPWVGRLAAMNPRRRELGLAGGLVAVLLMVQASGEVSAGGREAVVMFVMLALGVRSFVRRGPLWGTLVVGPILLGMATGTTMSMGRIALSAFPAAMDAAELIRSRQGVAIVCGGLVAIQVFYYLDPYVNWGFVG